MRASLLAMATTTTFFGARASSASSHAPIVRLDPCLIRNTAARCPVDEDLAEVDVAALADAEQLRLAAGRILSWHDTEPSSKVTALSKGRAVADGGNDSRGHDRPDARNLPDAGTPWVGRGDPFQLEAESLNLVLDGLPLLPKKIDQVPHLRCQVNVAPSCAL